jgi:MoxR-like ATPase
MTYKQFTGKGTDFYVAAPDTAEIVNLAIALERPILVEGEAGCGKTLLARAISIELGLGEPISIPVKSTSRAKDLLYRFDSLRRLQDSQGADKKKARNTYPYISLQPLGAAIHNGKPCVVLVDEIDKADIDFPNDLLDVIGDFQFDIEDLPDEEDAEAITRKGFGRRVARPHGARPIVVITSNREKQLPEPFLRRCLYLQLAFPDDISMLSEIAKKNLRLDENLLPLAFRDAAASKFIKIRAEAKAKGYHKPPSTSEFVDWVKVLTWNKVPAPDLETQELGAPHWRILFKNMNHLDAFRAEADKKPQ